MPEQTIQLQAAWYSGSAKRWLPPPGSRPAIDAGLNGGSANYFYLIALHSDGSFSFRLISSQADISSNIQDDLTDEFEQNGSIELIVNGNSLLVAIDGADTTEPYSWSPSNSAEVIAFRALLSDVDGTESGQLIIRDFVPETSKIYVGSSLVTKVYLASELVDRIYVGTIRVFLKAVKWARSLTGWLMPRGKKVVRLDYCAVDLDWSRIRKAYIGNTQVDRLYVGGKRKL